jgi:hypothetical protein
MSPLAGSGSPQCVKCGTPMRFANRRAVAAFRYRYERWKFECPKCMNMQTYTMGTTNKTSKG